MNRFRIAYLVALLLLFSCQQKPHRLGMPNNFSATIPDTITIVSYNVENLFDMVDNGDEYPEYKPNRSNWTNNTYQIKCANIASVLAQVNADIAVLVEVENENALSGLLSALAEKKCPYPFYALGRRTNRQRDAGCAVEISGAMGENVRGRGRRLPAQQKHA